jgi:hypothetical protein
MMKKCKFISPILFVLFLFMASSTYAVVIGDFEGGSMDGWMPGGAVTTAFSSTTGVTLNSCSLAAAPNGTGFVWALQRDGVEDLDANPILSLDVTWVTSEWVDDGSGGAWVNLKDIAVNSGAGWSQYIPDDPTNPSYPGSWDPYNWGEVHTRTLTWDLSDYDMSLVTNWMQIYLSFNSGGFEQTGNFYIDNIQLIPEPATMMLLGLGGIALLRKR